MGNSKEPQPNRAEEIIAAFDRERAEAHELNRRHAERVRASYEKDRPLTSNPYREKPANPYREKPA
jgi:hypothetical protein